MSNYRLVRPDNNNIFYRTLAAISTVGILVITGIEVSTALKEGNTAEDQMAEILTEIKSIRNDTLAEVKMVRAEVIEDLKTLKKQTLTEFKSASALEKVETAQNKILTEVKAIREEVLKDLRGFENVLRESR